jgi:hypothetical protein
LAGRNEAMSDNDIASDIEPTTDAFPMNNDHSRPNSGCDIITPGRCPRPVSHAASQSRRYCQQTDSTPLSRHLPVPGVPHGVSEMSVRSRIQPVIQSLRAAHRQSAGLHLTFKKSFFLTGSN